MVIGAEDILRTLPHRYPFLQVDRLVELVPGKRAVAVKMVSADAPYSFRAGGLASPEMMVIEAMAQVGALTYALSVDGAGPVEGYLAGLNDVVFHRRPEAGDQLVLTLEFVAAMGPLARFLGKAVINGEAAVEAGLTFTVERQK